MQILFLLYFIVCFIVLLLFYDWYLNVINLSVFYTVYTVRSVNCFMLLEIPFKVSKWFYNKRWFYYTFLCNFSREAVLRANFYKCKCVFMYLFWSWLSAFKTCLSSQYFCKFSFPTILHIYVHGNSKLTDISLHQKHKCPIQFLL